MIKIQNIEKTISDDYFQLSRKGNMTIMIDVVESNIEEMLNRH